MFKKGKMPLIRRFQTLSALRGAPYTEGGDVMVPFRNADLDFALRYCGKKTFISDKFYQLKTSQDTQLQTAFVTARFRTWRVGRAASRVGGGLHTAVPRYAAVRNASSPEHAQSCAVECAHGARGGASGLRNAR